MYMIIYKTTNLINNKFYIGKDAKNKKSYLGSGKVLKQAIQKYGKENFKKEILEYCTDLEHLDEREIYWIDKYNALEEGYNLTEGGTGGDTWTGNNLETHWNAGKTPWNKGLSGKYPHEPWNKGLKGYMGANKSSFKPGKDHALYGIKQKEETIRKRVEANKANGTYELNSQRLKKPVINIQDGKTFDSVKECAEYYNLTKDQVGHSCRKKTKKGVFRFV